MKAKERVFNNVTEQRRKTMSKIRGKNTTIEVTLQKALWAKGYRYRKNYKKLPGSPDICLTKYRREIQELEQKISWNKKKITVLNDKKKNADSEKAKIIKEEIKDLRNEKKHNQQELDELKNLYKISDEIEEI